MSKHKSDAAPDSATTATCTNSRGMSTTADDCPVHGPGKHRARGTAREHRLAAEGRPVAPGRLAPGFRTTEAGQVTR